MLGFHLKWYQVNHSLVHLNLLVLPHMHHSLLLQFHIHLSLQRRRKESENVRKLPILIDIDGVVVGDNASRWNTRAGSLIRARIPVSYTDWRLVHSEFKDKVWNALMREFEVTNVDQALARSHAEKNFSTKFRYGKWVLRKDILNKFETLEEQIAACPAGIDPNHWEQINKIDKIHRRVDTLESGHERRNGTVLESARARYELVEAAQKKRKSATSSGEGSATHLDFYNDELTEVLGADKKSRTRGISSNLSKKQLKRTSIAKVMLAQARSSSNSEFNGEMSEMKSSIARVEGVLMDMLKLVTNNGMSNSQPPHGDTTPGTDVGSNSVRRPSQQNLMNMFES
ncbi:hypothetical protein IFM89_034214 [Coptis chinensis]|uniref:Uncharacterized protein n=1 Tax=Coptis chinensis TaxID=261450 RepID=A0A835LJC1_9MAGN|nr:hypothetical protein IFM89_034214 [Coptis chinensis]